MVNRKQIIRMHLILFLSILNLSLVYSFEGRIIIYNSTNTLGNGSTKIKVSQIYIFWGIITEFYLNYSVTNSFQNQNEWKIKLESCIHSSAS